MRSTTDKPGALIVAGFPPSCRAKGIVFVPASGRSKTGMINSMGELGEDLKRDGAPLVCMNGLTVRRDGNMVFVAVVRASAAAVVLRRPLFLPVGCRLRLDGQPSGAAACVCFGMRPMACVVCTDGFVDPRPPPEVAH